MVDKVINVVIAGLGGQGVLKASDILAEAAFRAGFDVKKSEIHGMAQRGGSVSSDVRLGPKVASPMVPTHGADFLVVLAGDQVEVNRPTLRPGGKLLTPDLVDEKSLANPRSHNVAMLGALSVGLPIAESVWVEAIKASLPDKLHEANLQAFQAGRKAGQ